MVQFIWRSLFIDAEGADVMHCSTDEEDSSVWRQDDSDEAVVGCVWLHMPQFVSFLHVTALKKLQSQFMVMDSLYQTVITNKCALTPAVCVKSSRWIRFISVFSVLWQWFTWFTMETDAELSNSSESNPNRSTTKILTAEYSVRVLLTVFPT